MSFKSVISLTPIAPADAITPASDFTHFFAAAAKPASLWAVGTEVELFGFTRESLARIDSAEVQSLIEGFSPQIISRVTENGYVTEATLKGEGGMARGSSGVELREARMRDEEGSYSPPIPHPSS